MITHGRTGALAAAVGVVVGLGGCSVTGLRVQRAATAGAEHTAAPRFSLPSHRGGTFDSERLAKKRVALVFYRGFW